MSAAGITLTWVELSYLQKQIPPNTSLEMVQASYPQPGYVHNHTVIYLRRAPDKTVPCTRVKLEHCGQPSACALVLFSLLI